MNVRGDGLCLLASFTLALGACAGEGSRSPADAATAPPVDAGSLAAPDAPDAAEDAASDVTVPDLVSQPLPPDISPPRRIVAGTAQLVGAGTSACTNQVPASGNGDRWCAFKRPGADGRSTELW